MPSRAAGAHESQFEILGLVLLGFPTLRLRLIELPFSFQGGELMIKCPEYLEQVLGSHISRRCLRLVYS